MAISIADPEPLTVRDVLLNDFQFREPKYRPKPIAPGDPVYLKADGTLTNNPGNIVCLAMPAPTGKTIIPIEVGGLPAQPKPPLGKIVRLDDNPTHVLSKSPDAASVERRRNPARWWQFWKRGK